MVGSLYINLISLKTTKTKLNGEYHIAMKRCLQYTKDKIQIIAEEIQTYIRSYVNTYVIYVIGMPPTIYIWNFWKVLLILSTALNSNLLSLLGGVGERGEEKNDW